jgi:hypothetical protein
VNPSWCGEASLDVVARTTAEFLVTGDKDVLALHPFRGNRPCDAGAIPLEGEAAFARLRAKYRQ